MGKLNKRIGKLEKKSEGEWWLAGDGGPMEDG